MRSTSGLSSGLYGRISKYNHRGGPQHATSHGRDIENWFTFHPPPDSSNRSTKPRAAARNGFTIPQHAREPDQTAHPQGAEAVMTANQASLSQVPEPTRAGSYFSGFSVILLPVAGVMF